MNDPTQSRAIHLLMVLGLLLVGLFLLLLFSGALAPLQTQSPLSDMPAPATPVLAPRATIPGLMEGSGPTVNPQEGQESAPRPSN